MLDAEITHRNTSGQIRILKERAANRLEAHGVALENELNYRALPIRSLVGVQTCAGLATAEFLNSD